MTFKEWANATQKARTEEVIAYFEGVSVLADMLSLPDSTVRSWQRRGRISRSGARLIDKTTKGRFSEGYLIPGVLEWFQLKAGK